MYIQYVCGIIGSSQWEIDVFFWFFGGSHKLWSSPTWLQHQYIYKLINLLADHWPTACVYKKGVPLSTDRLARWVKEVIAQAHLNSGLPAFSSVKWLSPCTMASTWASLLKKEVLLADICKAATWSLQSTYEWFFYWAGSRINTLSNSQVFALPVCWGAVSGCLRNLRNDFDSSI